MARIHNSKFWGCILILITLFSNQWNGFVYARSDIKNETLKTMKLKNGDVIDCVDIYKQPAFSHPLLKNHTIQIKPSSYPIDQLGVNSKIEPLEDLFEACHCPEGTIPIIRNNKKSFPIRIFQSVHQDQDFRVNEFRDPPGQEFAQVSMVDGRFYGAQGGPNIWQPHVELKNEASGAQIYVIGGQDTIQAGWQVDPTDNEARFNIHWTADNYGKTGCTNLNCPGFVQTSSAYPLGSPIRPSSTYRGKQYDLFINIYKDKKTGNWWLQVRDRVLGYWPRNIFRTISNGAATRISWGGFVINSKRFGRHTSTDMGSGHSSSGGYGKAAYFNFLGYVDETYIGRAPTNDQLLTYASKPQCYDVHVVPNTAIGFGKYFFYGGPGFSGRCRN